MQLLVGHDVAVATWVGEKIGVPMIPPYTALGWIDDRGLLRIGFVFFGYNGSNMDVAIAMTHSLTRGVIRAVAHYIFEQSGCVRCTLRPPRKNVAACSILKRLGFVQECICKRFYGSEDAVQLRMLKSECRWLS